MGYYFTYKILHLFHREIPGFQRHLHYKNGLAWFGFMVLITTFNNISAILWRSVLLVEETGVPRESIKDCLCLIKYVLRCLYIEDDSRFIFLTEIKNVGKPETDIDV